MASRVPQSLWPVCLQVKLVDAGFLWTEPHSKRLKVKLTIQAEVFNGAILQQTFVVECAPRAATRQPLRVACFSTDRHGIRLYTWAACLTPLPRTACACMAV